MLIPAIKAIVVTLGLLVGFAYMTLAERKICARFQLRYGPNQAGPFGIFQPIADALKAIFKEEIVPEHVDKWLYIVCPVLAMVPAILAFAVIPVGQPIVIAGRTITLQVADINVGLLYPMAVAGLGAYGIVLGGWSSNNNYSLLGALRTTAQIISYELPMALSLVSLVIVTGTLRMSGIVEYQAALPLIVLQPIGFLIYFICGLAETNRSPFDFPETENELISGYNTEYGGIKFALFFMAEYINMIVVSALVATLFLGGWQGPILPGWLWFFIKTAVMLFVFVWVRASLPRARYDKLMHFCWKFLTPLAVVNLLVTAAVVLILR
ncbi:MAG: NADH-quinone oxidoreductase subunit NuoH [Anaerolineae bacterium]